MKTRLLFLLAAMGLLASCSKEMEDVSVESVNEPSAVKTYVSVGLSTATKTYMDAEKDDQNHHKMYWSEGDRIVINGIVSDALGEFDEPTQYAEFAFEGELSTPYEVLYPASIYIDETHINLPGIQTYKADGFADGMFPMVGFAEEDEGVNLTPLCALVKVSVLRAPGDNADSDPLIAVRFKGRDGEQVKGSFVIDYENATLTDDSDSSEDQEVKISKKIATSTEKPVVYYLAVPARTYAKGFDIVIQDAAGHIMTKSKTASVTLESGHLYAMPEIEFVPTDTEIGIEITNASEFIQFVSDYNNKVYDDKDNLIVTLTEDLYFDSTSSSEFNATGGLGLKAGINGEEDYYFNGILNGADHHINGLKSTVPLIVATGSYGGVTNLTLADHCSFTFYPTDEVDGYYGAVVGYHKGLMANVVVEADITIESAEVTIPTAVGGLVGRGTTGTIENCDYTGNITVPSSFSSTSRTYIGGLVGYISNEYGIVSDSSFDGTLDIEARVSSTDKVNPYLLVGGIIGSNAGTISNCSTTAVNNKTITMDNGKDYTATIQNHSTLSYHTAQGGIAGMNLGTISGCTNEATTSNFILTTGASGTASDANSRYYDFGGIVGLNQATGTVTECKNIAPLETRCSPRIQKIGGLVGYNKGTVSSCSNEATGTIYITTTNISPYSVRVGEIGGAIGNNEGAVSDIQNAGNIRLDRTENAAGVELKMGGVIGLSSAVIDGGESKNISNSGNIQDEYNGTTVTTAGLRFGGIVGSATASVKNVTNTGDVVYKLSAANVMSKLHMGGIVGELRGAGDVEISGCENEGTVFFNVNSKNAAHTDNYVGGILGRTVSYSVTDTETEETTVYATNVVISDCVNAGYIHGGNPSKNNGKTLFVGGIVAYLDGVSSISECQNIGELRNDQFNNTNTKVGSVFEGGIAGFVLGTEENRITISDVDNTIDATINKGAGPRRGFGGGAVGYAEYADISNATNTGNYTGSSSYWLGGIAGWIVNSTISDSIYYGQEIQSSQIQAAGGIVAVLDAGSSIIGCSSYLSSITHGSNACVDGDIAGKSVATSTISGCHYTGTYGICSDSNWTDGGGNVADL